VSSPSRIVTSTFVSYQADTSRRQASLVVAAIDDFTNEPPRAALRVALKEQPRRAPARNPSGHYVFFDLADGDHTLVVEPDPVNADWFFLRPTGSDNWTTAFERTVTLPKADPLAPLEHIVLTPKPTYPFPAGTTLVLGSVSQGAARVPLAVITTSYERVKKDDPDDTETVDLATATDRTGFFVLSFHSLKDKRQDIEVTATLGAASATATVSITEGKTAMTALVLP
jgi:hypothetical protein